MSTRIFRLIERHARIDDALRLEQQRAGGDWQRINELKRLKLRIKDLIHRFITRQRPARSGS
jgi:uncharacterized protein YdcH (DUF465 family)